MIGFIKPEGGKNIFDYREKLEQELPIWRIL